MVNIGSFAGPFLAGWAHSHLRVENVFRLAALSVFLMFVAVLVFFKEPRQGEQAQGGGIREVLANFAMVAANWRFVLFILIFSGYWIVFWQQYLILPIYIHDYVDANANTAMILIADPLIVITCTVLVNALTKRIPSFRAITLGTLITALAWLILAAKPSVLTAVLALMGVALGEIIQSPRYYEYISRLAPADRQGSYLGFAFLPIGIGSLVGGWTAGKLLHHFGEMVQRPQMIWWVVAGIGVLTAILLFIYDRTVRPATQTA
jgi:dipeptide/tripeptide permease